MQIINSIRSFFQFGNNYQTIINVDNDILNDFIKNIREDFFSGNISKAIENLEKLIIKYDSNKYQDISYHLLLLKAKFYIYLQKIEAFEELINYIERHYQNLDINFKELRLTLLSLKDKKEEFWNIANDILAKRDNLSTEYFKMMYYLNNDVIKAKEVYDEIEEKSNFNILYNGFLIYSKLYEINQKKEYFNIADNLVQEIKEIKKDLNFFEKMSIYGFYALSKINNFLMGKKDNIDFDIDNYKKLIEIIIKNKDPFDKGYVKKIVDIYLYIFLYQNNIEEYKQRASQYLDLISNFHYFNFLMFKSEKLNHKTLQEKAKRNREDFIFYVSLLFEENIQFSDKEKIKKFLLTYNEKFIIKNDYLIYVYCKFLKRIPKTIKIYVVKHKYKNLYILLSFLNLNKNVTDKDLIKLIQFAEQENNIFGLIYDVLIVLQKNKKIKELLDLAINKQDIFKDIVFETLKIIFDDRNITYNEFLYFLDNIKIQKEHYTIIGNIFVKFERYYEAFEYFWKVYEENKDNVEVIISLLRLIWNYYNISNEILDKNKQTELFSKLLSKARQLDLNQTVFLFYYSLYLIKETNQTIYILNQKLLNFQENDINDELFNNLTQLYFLQFEIKYKNLFFIDNNECLVDYENKTIYIKQDYQISNFYTKLNIKKIDEIEYLSLKEKGLKEESFLHIILPYIVFRDNNPNLITLKIDKNSDNPLKELFDFVNEMKQDEIKLFNEFSNENNAIGLFSLAKNDYKNYFTLIPFSLNSEWNFNSLKLNYLNKPKILTFSSIIFLDELNLLDKVLVRNDIVIQKSLINWLKRYIEEINYNNLPLEYDYLENEKINFKPYTNEIIEETKILKKKLLSLLQKLRKCILIDDHVENLPVKESFDMFSNQIGFQEYWAFVYCLNHNYQIISENNIFEFLFDKLKLNKFYISNSLSLLDNESYISIIEKLFKQNYKYLVDELIEERLIYKAFSLKFQFSDIDKILIKEANKYGFLERIKRYYYYKFEVLYPKKYLPKKNFFDKNIEKIIKIIKE